MGGIKYLLDTNVLSEPAKLKPNERVMQHLASKNGQYATASVVWHELHYGCHCLPRSKRKTELLSYLDMLNTQGLIVLPYDQVAAVWFSKQRARLKSQGNMPTYADGEIAAIAAVNDLTLVTRNIKDFQCYAKVSLANWFD